jgi:hypothetical protein
MADIVNCSSASAGVSQASVLRGRKFEHGRNRVCALRAEIGASWEILAQQSVGVLVGAALGNCSRRGRSDRISGTS